MVGIKSHNQFTLFTQLKVSDDLTRRIMKHEFSSPFEMISVGLDKQVMKPYKQGTARFAGLTFHGSPFSLVIFQNHF